MPEAQYSITVSEESHASFARLSGDYNPIHVDQLASRRLMFGGVVVHGVHTVLRALDGWAARRGEPPLALRSLKAVLRAPLRPGQVALCTVRREEAGRVELRLSAGASHIASVRFAWREAPPPNPGEASGEVPEGEPVREGCQSLAPEAMAEAAGEVPVSWDRRRARELFPNLTRAFPAVQTALVCAITRAVGMRCPGLHSLLSSLDLEFSEPEACPERLRYAVTAWDQRFSMAGITVSGSGLRGLVQAYLRPAPCGQQNCATLSELVRPGEFAGQRALVVGAGRGLGEVTAKLLALGGAEVRMTYHTGAEDCRAVAGEIQAGGGDARCLPFDILEPPGDLASRLGEGFLPTHLYYYATPFIFQASAGSFSHALFEKFCAYYLRGLAQTVEALQSLGARHLWVFCPSSVAVDELPPNMGEYAAAKAACEVLCDFLQKTGKGLRFRTDRLPRMATDQTASLLPVDNRPPAPTLLDILRQMGE